MIKIVFPEIKDATIAEAIAGSPEIEAVGADDLRTACQMVKAGQADAIIAGINYTSREVILSCRESLGMTGTTFTSSFVLTRGEQKFVLADAATCKNPDEQQLYDIVLQTYRTAKIVLDDMPRLAMLSFSTMGSGTNEPSLDRIRKVIARTRVEHPEITIDGEMQLDAAVNITIGGKKAPRSEVAGEANVLICPDINSGNILYKSIEQFGGFTAAGPILQGFNYPASDLSRGSTVADVIGVIKVLQKLVEKGDNINV